MKNKKVVVTGGCGFIGSNLAEELSKDNETIIIDDLSTGKIINIKNLLGKDNVKFIKGSITNLNLLKNIFEDIDYVFHQAAIPSVPRSVKNPLRTNNANINGTLDVLIAARDNSVKKVVYASSSSIYGDTPTLPKKESMTLTPLSPYAITKLTGEYYCKVFNDIYKLPTVSLRYFNVYGPRQDPLSEYAAVIPKFIRRVLNDEPPIIYGDGEQTRDFTYIKDVMRANILAAESDKTGVFNIGSGARVPINKLAKMIVNLAGKDNFKPIHNKLRKGDVKHSLADISRAREDLDYEPEYDLGKGLEIAIKWFSNSGRN